MSHPSQMHVLCLGKYFAIRVVIVILPWKARKYNTVENKLVNLNISYYNGNGSIRRKLYTFYI